MMAPKPIMLMILDGWGLGKPGKENAVHIARTPFLDSLLSSRPATRLLCSGKAVGLPAGIMGNSEVGHLNIGAGRVVYQDLLRIDQAIQDGSFFGNRVFRSVIHKVRNQDATLHLMGLVSDGGVHSQITHLFALLDLAKREGLYRIAVHAILDGRDTPPESGAGYLREVQTRMRERGIGALASVCGRYYAMDRDNRWERTEKAHRLYTGAEGRKAADPVQAVHESYLKKETDEFVKPICISDPDGKPVATVKDGDGVIFFNFRADRARQITKAFTDPDADGFQREFIPDLSGYVCMTCYDESFALPVAFPPEKPEDILGEVISRKGLRQLRIAETEKYAHVTYFFNGGEEKPFPLEDRCLIPSPRDVATYDLKPEMSAFEVTDETLRRLQSNRYDLIILNFANLDMVGHTGVLEAAVKACEVVDACAKIIIQQVLAAGGVALVTADHGNSEKMQDRSGNVFTAHTLNPVPFVLVDDRRQSVALRQGCLADIAPTILELMGIGQPAKMTGRSLIEAH